MRRGVCIAGLVLFGSGAGLAGWVSAAGSVRMREVCGTEAVGACESVRGGVTTSGLAALVCASMAMLAARGARRTG